MERHLGVRNAGAGVSWNYFLIAVSIWSYSRFDGSWKGVALTFFFWRRTSSGFSLMATTSTLALSSALTAIKWDGAAYLRAAFITRHRNLSVRRIDSTEPAGIGNHIWMFHCFYNNFYTFGSDCYYLYSLCFLNSFLITHITLCS